MRAMLTSFSSYSLHNNWRDTARHLANLFTDYEPGIHYPQIQMQSGITGINTLRIYNPIKQGLDFDPTGSFIRFWVPELARLPLFHLHQPWIMSPSEKRKYGFKIGLDYPAPEVNHASNSKVLAKKIYAIKSLKETKEVSKHVYEQHGSRKTKTRVKTGRKAVSLQQVLNFDD